tara:strand:+ start:2916 stop:3062 length:147 start_codon:yes stop_codon:yes gene_type:complete
MESFEVGKILEPSTGQAMTRRGSHEITTISDPEVPRWEILVQWPEDVI